MPWKANWTAHYPCYFHTVYDSDHPAVLSYACLNVKVNSLCSYSIAGSGYVVQPNITNVTQTIVSNTEYGIFQPAVYDADFIGLDVVFNDMKAATVSFVCSGYLKSCPDTSCDKTPSIVFVAGTLTLGAVFYLVVTCFIVYLCLRRKLDPGECQSLIVD